LAKIEKGIIIQVVDSAIEVAKLMATAGRKHDDAALVSGDE
jgi:hypothetical protein